MMNFNKIKKIAITTILVGLLFMQGCTGSAGDNASTDQSNSNIDNGKINIEIDQTNHVFVITSNELGEDFRQEGKILTYSYPETANVYRITPFDNYQSSALYNPIKEWKSASFQVLTLTEGQNVYKNNVEGKDSLCRTERIGLINSLMRIEAKEFKQMNVIKSGYSDAVFADYIVKYTFPATKKDLYEVTHFDLKLNYDVVLDDVKDRPLDYYVIRRAIDGITVGLPDNAIESYYQKYDTKTKILKYIYSEAGKFFYDGESVYEVHNNSDAKPDDLEIFLKDQPVLSLEKALNKVAPNIYNSLSYSARTGGDTHFYAVELVYLTIGTSDCSNGDYENASMYTIDYDNACIYPFWVIYMLDNIVVASHDVAQIQPILVNAITGEVIICD